MSVEKNERTYADRCWQFLYKDPEKGRIRLDATKLETLQLIGKTIGQQILFSFQKNKPVYGVNVFGQHLCGKSAFSISVFNEFQHDENDTIKERMTIEKVDSSYPKCLHIDYWLSRTIMNLKYDKYSLNNDTVLISEWSERMPSKMFSSDRIEVEMLRCDSPKDAWKSTKAISNIKEDKSNMPPFCVATLVGYGNGMEYVEQLKEINELKQFQIHSI